MGAGDCLLDRYLMDQLGCEVVPVDVGDSNQTSLPLTVYDGHRLPFADDSFDVVLLIFVLHHTRDPRAVLSEAKRVCRRHVIVFEDINLTFWDRLVFRGFHHLIQWTHNIGRPFHIWPPERWAQLGEELGFRVHWRGMIGRQLGYLASRHIGFVFEKEEQVAAAPWLPERSTSMI